MNLPNLRILAVTAGSMAIMTGMFATATAANAAPAAPAVHAARTAAQPAAAAGTVTAPVTGTFSNADGTGTFTGNFSPTSFSVVNGALMATGQLTGKMVDANGTQLGTVSKTVTTTVDTNAANAPLACNVLNLVLGPLNLNLLGLVVTLNQIHLNITAVPGAGALLGNLLCDVAGLLNGGGALTAIATLLNEILALL
jgi:hypothetical protein